MSDADHDRPLASAPMPACPEPREGLDAGDHAALAADPRDADAQLDIALDETFPTSDPPGIMQPGKGADPVPSSGFTETAPNK